MADNTYTIIIKNKTTGSTRRNITEDDVDSDGTVKNTSKYPSARKSKGRPRTGKAVEHNRFSRIYNSTMNKITGGVWEKANRAGKATKGLLFYSSFVGANILGQFGMNEFFRQWNAFKQTQQERNEKDALKIRVGAIDLGSGDSYSINRNFFSGRIHYKTNR